MGLTTSHIEPASRLELTGLDSSVRSSGIVRHGRRAEEDSWNDHYAEIAREAVNRVHGSPRTGESTRRRASQADTC